jgi:hypothetical protein
MVTVATLFCAGDVAHAWDALDVSEQRSAVCCLLRTRITVSPAWAGDATRPEYTCLGGSGLSYAR